MTALVDQLFDRYGVAAVGFDVVFAEPDTSSGLDTLKQLAQRDLAGSRDFQAALKQLMPRLDYDARFARVLAERPLSLAITSFRKATVTPEPACCRRPPCQPLRSLRCDRACRRRPAMARIWPLSRTRPRVRDSSTCGPMTMAPRGR